MMKHRKNNAKWWKGREKTMKHDEKERKNSEKWWKRENKQWNMMKKRGKNNEKWWKREGKTMNNEKRKKPAKRSNILSFDYFNFRIFYLVGARPCVFCYSILSRLRVQYSIFQPVTIYKPFTFHKRMPPKSSIHNDLPVSGVRENFVENSTLPNKQSWVVTLENPSVNVGFPRFGWRDN